MNIDNIRQMIKTMLDAVPHFEPSRRQVFRDATPSRRKRSTWGSNNHSQGESKKRRKMAQMSNRINRKRVNNWKH